jgi:citronellol/citronellal dehydrogenase
MKRYDLINGVNTRGTFLVTQKCLPHILAAPNPHILTISPPLHMEERWFAPHVAYSIAKFGMSLVTLGVAGEFRGCVAANALWPRTAIDTAAMTEFKSRLHIGRLRSPEIMADAAYLVRTSDAKVVTGHFFVDDEVLAAHGVADFSRYNPPGVADPDITPDLFVPSLLELSRKRELGPS